MSLLNAFSYLIVISSAQLGLCWSLYSSLLQKNKIYLLTAYIFILASTFDRVGLVNQYLFVLSRFKDFAFHMFETFKTSFIARLCCMILIFLFKGTILSSNRFRVWYFHLGLNQTTVKAKRTKERTNATGEGWRM